MSTFRVCIVDDDPMARVVAADSLDDKHYTLSECETGEACVELFEGFDDLPDVVLLDIEMPGIDGYETCRRIRAAGNDSVQIIFVSGRDDLESRLAAFDAGGSDFVLKPFAAKELRHHVALAESNAGSRRALSEQISYAQRAAFSAMSSMGEMGAILQFMRDSFACSSEQDVANRIFDAMNAYGLNTVVQFRDAAGDRSFAVGGPCTELEISILNYVRKLDRIVQLGERLVINYPRSTLLVLNLPLDDPDRIGRLRDHLAIVAEGVEARLASLEVEQKRSVQAQGILDAVSTLTQTLAEIEQRQESNRRAALDVTGTFHEKLLNSFLGMGLSDRQEHLLGEMAEETINGIAQLMASDEVLGARLKQVSGSLAALLNQ